MVIVDSLIGAEGKPTENPRRDPSVLDGQLSER
jgi:hypothetical protein